MRQSSTITKMHSLTLVHSFFLLMPISMAYLDVLWLKNVTSSVSFWDQRTLSRLHKNGKFIFAIHAKMKNHKLQKNCFALFGKLKLHSFFQRFISNGHFPQQVNCKVLQSSWVGYLQFSLYDTQILCEIKFCQFWEVSNCNFRDPEFLFLE